MAPNASFCGLLTIIIIRTVRCLIRKTFSWRLNLYRVNYSSRASKIGRMVLFLMCRAPWVGDVLNPCHFVNWEGVPGRPFPGKEFTTDEATSFCGCNASWAKCASYNHSHKSAFSLISLFFFFRNMLNWFIYLHCSVVLLLIF